MTRPKTKTILIGLALFVFFLVLRFPYRNLRGYVFSQVYRNTGIRIDAEDMAPSFLGWPGIRLYKVSASIPISRDAEMDLAAEEITARIGLGGLFPPHALFSLYAYRFQKGGNLYVKANPGSETTSGRLWTDSLSLSQFLNFGLPEPIQGLLNASGEFDYNTQDLSKTTGQFNLTIDKLHIPGQNLQGILLPSISWDEVRARLDIKEGNLDITECQFGTPKSDLRGALSGSVRLGRSWWTSYVDVSLRIQMSASYKENPQAATLVSFLKTFENPKKPGEYAMKWSARVADMSQNIMLALPTKIE